MPDPVRDSRRRQRPGSILDVRSDRRVHPYQRKLSDLMSKFLLGLLAGACLTAVGQERPPAEMEVFRNVSEALANQDTDAFLDQFDAKMPQYEKLRGEIQELFAVAQEIGST